MEMVSFMFETTYFISNIIFSYRYYKQWASHITQVVSGAVSVMNAWMEYHLQLMWIIRYTVLMTTIECLPRNVHLVEKVRFTNR